MKFLCWLNDNAGAIQAICAILGIVGLGIYCWLTHSIRTATVAQQKASQAPMLMFLEEKSKWGDTARSVWIVKNYGVGPAISIWWKPGVINAKSEDWYKLGSLAAADTSDIPHSSRPEQAHMLEMPDEGARLHYSDSAGNHYATWGFWKDGSFFQDWSAIKKRDRLEIR